MKQEKVVYYGVDKPYELYYRNEASEYPVGVHTHNVMEIYLTLTDLPDVLLDGEVMQMSAGTLIMIPAFCTHQLYHERNVVYERYILNIDTQWLERVLAFHKDTLQELISAKKSVVLHLEPEQSKRLCEQLRAFYPQQDTVGIAGLTAFFQVLQVLEDILTADERENRIDVSYMTKEQKRINDIIAYINSHLMDGTTISQIAAHFYLNKDYLARFFVQHTHTTIGHYMIIQRIVKAQDLLRSGKTVPEVQELLGYSSYAYFFNSFKKVTGISPSRYRMQFCTVSEEEVLEDSLMDSVDKL